MKLKSKIFIFIVIISNFTFAQEINNEFKSIITFSTVSPLMSYAPRWNFGYIRKIDERYWLGVELGYGNKKFSVNFAEEGGWITDDYNSFEIKPELYYNLRPNSKLKHLLSLEFQYVNHTDEFNNTWYFELNDNNYYNYDFADYKRIKYGINVNYNLIFNITNNLALMQKVGLGYRNRDVRYSNIVNRVENAFFEEEGFILPDFNGFLRDNGNIGGFNFNLDLKLIYKL